ncbi:MAG: 50S ribosomal protein L24 [Candidatus Paceibacterota bacterium]
MKIIKGDNVLVISGKDRAKTGKVLKALPKVGRIVVDGVNIAKKSQRPRQQGQKGQVVSLPKSISVSNVKLICPKCGKAARVGYKVTVKEEGKEKITARVCKKCSAEI